ncbi:MAG TPA: dodecin family protein [Bdellovibrionota bacterium]|nr:dodecin family protein [Bdellovibrionota bacterium]
MPIAKVTEISSSSSKSFEDAINQGILRASQTIENIKGVWVKEQSCVVENGKVKEYRVDMKVTFVLKDTA